MKYLSRSLIARLVISFSLLSLLTVSLVGYVAYFNAREALKQSVFERLDANIVIKEDELIRWVDDQRREIILFAQLTEVQEQASVLMSQDEAALEFKAAYAQLAVFLQTLIESQPDIKEIMILADGGGRIVVSTDKAHEGDYRPTDTYFVRGRETTFLQSVYPWPVTLEPTMTIATPLLDPGGERLGVLAVHLNLDYVDKIIFERTGLGATGETYLVDSLNVFVSAERFGRQGFPRGVHTQGIDAAIRGEDGQGLYRNYTGEPVVGVYHWIDGLDLALMAEMHQSEAFAPAHRLGVTILLVGLVIAVLSALGIYWLARQVARPILAITETAVRVGAGDLTPTAPVLTQDEIGVLARTFNQMTTRVRELYEALQQSEEYFRSLIDNGSDVILVLSARGIVRYVSPSLKRVLGYDPQSWLGRAIFEFVHSDDLGRVRHELSRTDVELGDLVSLEVRVRHQDGSWQVFESLSNNLLSVPAVSGVVISARNVTDRKQAELQVQRQLERLHALHMIDIAISSSHDLEVMLNVILNQVMVHLGVDAADVLLLNPNMPLLEYVSGRGFQRDGRPHSFTRIGEGFAGQAALERRVVYVPSLMGIASDYGLDPTLSAEGFVAYYATPLIAKGQVRGVLEVFQRKPFELDREKMDFLETLAGQTAIAIDNITLFNDLQRSNLELVLAYDATIEGWSRALDLRDRETEGHTQRVTEMTVRLARAMGVSEGEVVHVRRGALLHDIGKMGVPDAILHKRGPLSEDEWEIMRKHPLYALEMLAPIDFLREAVDIPYCHHEMWDGKGYPRGLKGDQIPLAARIFAVVDSWDALRSDRPYRAAWPDERIRQHIQSQAGTQFDAQAVRVFLELSADRRWLEVG